MAWAVDVDHLPEQVRAAIASNFARTQPEQARQFLQALAPGRQRDQLIVGIVGQKAQTDIAEAQLWLAQIDGEGSYQKARQQLMYQWISQDPAAAAADVIDVDPPDHRGAYLSHLVNSWYARDPVAATQWVLSLSSDPLRDKALYSLIPRIASYNIEQAQSLLEQVSEPSMVQQIEQQLTNTAQRTSRLFVGSD